jgi:hypothetical protein
MGHLGKGRSTVRCRNKDKVKIRLWEPPPPDSGGKVDKGTKKGETAKPSLLEKECRRITSGKGEEGESR